MQRAHATVTELPRIPAPGPSADELNDASLAELVDAAKGGSSAAWDALLTRFTPLVRGVAGRYRLPAADAEDVAQAVWLKLCEKIHDLREAQALPRWLAVVTANECHHLLKSRKRTQLMAEGWEEFSTFSPSLRDSRSHEDEGQESRALREEGIRLVRDGMSELSQRHQQLLSLLVADPPLPYTEIGARLGMPVGSIGPTRARALAKLRQTHAVRGWVDSDTAALAA